MAQKISLDDTLCRCESQMHGSCGVLVEFSPTTRDIMVTVLSCSFVLLKGVDITQCQDRCVFLNGVAGKPGG